MIYLNNAATSFPKPESVSELIKSMASSAPINAKRGGGSSSADPIDIARKSLADFFKANDKNRIVFTSGSTESLNLAIKGLSLAGKHVIATATEHNSVIRPLYELINSNTIDVDFIRCNSGGYVSPDDIRRAFRKNTALVIVNHCSNVTGAVQDIAEIARLAHSNGAKILVDASQSAGNVEIDLQNDEIDLLAFTAHKALFGIAGTGGLYISENTKLKPLKTGGTGFKSKSLSQPTEMPIFYEAGTPNSIGIAALGQGVEFVRETTIEKISSHKAELARIFIDEFTDNPNIKFYLEESKSSYSAVSFNIVGIEPDELVYIAENTYNIKLRSGIHCCPFIHNYLGTEPHGTVRMSVSWFNTKLEIDIFNEAIYKIIDFAKNNS